MPKEREVPALSDVIRNIGVPLSLTRAPRRST
jgi:hypothetical protein